MKVISGIYKGRNLDGFSIEGTRPTMDRVKESLFAIIQNYIRGSIVLDLFNFLILIISIFLSNTSFKFSTLFINSFIQILYQII